LEYLLLLVDKMIGKWVPSRFVLFLAVGGLGLLVHMAVLALLYVGAGEPFSYAQVAATLVAMTFNFLLNNVTTFRDRRLRGVRLGIGLLTFYAACSVGAMMNLAFANFLLQAGLPWYAAGVAGVAVGSVWNYGVNTILTWRRSVQANQARPGSTNAIHPPRKCPTAAPNVSLFKKSTVIPNEAGQPVAR
jgi:dolichol-phosphate mannosyltransferase